MRRFLIKKPLSYFNIIFGIIVFAFFFIFFLIIFIILNYTSYLFYINGLQYILHEYFYDRIPSTTSCPVFYRVLVQPYSGSLVTLISSLDILIIPDFSYLAANKIGFINDNVFELAQNMPFSEIYNSSLFRVLADGMTPESVLWSISSMRLFVHTFLWEIFLYLLEGIFYIIFLSKWFSISKYRFLFLLIIIVCLVFFFQMQFFLLYFIIAVCCLELFILFL